MSAAHIEGVKAAMGQRHAAIDHLHFTYRQLVRVLPDIARRTPQPLASTLNDQCCASGKGLQSLEVVANELGQTPSPRLCAEAASLIDGLFHAERGTSARDVRGLATVLALKSIRAFLTREWGRLMDVLPGDLLPNLRSEAMELQRQEMVQHRDLAILAEALHRSRPAG